MEQPLIQLAIILLLGVIAQWLAWRLRWPAILLLLLAGIAAGPVFEWVQPDVLFGPALSPVISLFVAVVLFEGGLNLRFRELEDATVLRLVTIGILITFGLSVAASYYLLDLPLRLSFLFGAILVVTGPTVILPLLRAMKLTGRVASILKWEGIVNDPIGAILAVLIFEALLPHHGTEGAPAQFGMSLAAAIWWGGIFGVVGAGLIVPLLRFYLVPDYLQSTVVLALVAGVFAASDWFQAESGLIAVTLMGALLANQKWADLSPTVEFKENLRVLLISLLFILLAARMEMADLQTLNWQSVGFILVLVLVIRPASVFASTLRSELTWRERVFVSAVAPRGVVAAAVTSTFAIELARAGDPEASRLVPLMFAVIIGTITFCALTSIPLARVLGVAESSSNGYLIVGANPLARAMAVALKTEGVRTLLVDSNWTHIRAARMAGLETHHGNALSESILDELDLRGIGRLLAITSNDEANSLAAVRFAKQFDRANVYQLPQSEKQGSADNAPKHLGGRYLFGKQMTYGTLLGRLYRGGTIKTTPLTEQFDYDAFQAKYGDFAIPLFYVTGAGNVKPFTAEKPPRPDPGQKLISLISEQPAPPAT